MIICKRPDPPDDHLQVACPSIWSFASSWILQMIICKWPSPPYDHLQVAGSSRWSFAQGIKRASRGSHVAIGLVWWVCSWFIRHICLYINDPDFQRTRMGRTDQSKIMQEVLTDLKNRKSSQTVFNIILVFSYYYWGVIFSSLLLGYIYICQLYNSYKRLEQSLADNECQESWLRMATILKVKGPSWYKVPSKQRTYFLIERLRSPRERSMKTGIDKTQKPRVRTGRRFKIRQAHLSSLLKVDNDL